MKYTPEDITSFKEDEVFVLGSNLAGNHAGGAPQAARERFGAIMGQDVRPQGQSYAIPTMQGGVETIRPYVDEFIEFAKVQPKLKFYVTRIGCGIAGFQDEEIVSLFSEALEIENIILPESFVKHPIRIDELVEEKKLKNNRRNLRQRFHTDNIIY